MEYVLINGHLYHRTGVMMYVLRECDIPESDRRADWVTRLVGTVVMMAPDGMVITVYRNRNSSRDIRRKRPFYREHARRHGWARE